MPYRKTLHCAWPLLATQTLNKNPDDVKADGVWLTLRIRLCIGLDSRRRATVDADVTRTSGDT